MNQHWSELGKHQEAFAIAIATLILWAAKHDIQVRIKDCYRDPRAHGAWGIKKGYGAANSVHKVSLAADIWTKNEIDYILMHDEWDILGGAERIPGDANHFSFEWQGAR